MIAYHGHLRRAIHLTGGCPLIIYEGLLQRRMESQADSITEPLNDNEPIDVVVQVASRQRRFYLFASVTTHTSIVRRTLVKCREVCCDRLSMIMSIFCDFSSLSVSFPA